MKYFARIRGQQQGPYTLQELVDAGIRPDDWVWCKGMDDWRRAKEVGDVCRYFRQSISDQMNPRIIDDTAIKGRDDEIDRDNHHIGGYMEYLARKAGEEMRPDQEPAHDIEHKPRTWIMEAVLITVLCFPPTGFIAIYYGWKSNKSWDNGKHRESHEYARNAKMWCGITFFLGFIAYAIYSHLLSR